MVFNLESWSVPSTVGVESERKMVLNKIKMKLSYQDVSSSPHPHLALGGLKVCWYVSSAKFANKL